MREAGGILSSILFRSPCRKQRQFAGDRATAGVEGRSCHGGDIIGVVVIPGAVDECRDDRGARR